MVIVLFLFVLLFFPIKFTIKINIDFKNAYFVGTLYFFRLLVSSIQIISYKDKLFYVLSRFEPKPIKLKKSKKKGYDIPIRYDFFRGERLDIMAKIGIISPSVRVLTVGIMRIILPQISHIIDDRLRIEVIPDFFDNNVKVFSNLTVFTCLGLIIFQFIKRAVKGVKYALQQSH